MARMLRMSNINATISAGKHLSNKSERYIMCQTQTRYAKINAIANSIGILILFSIAQ